MEGEAGFISENNHKGAKQNIKKVWGVVIEISTGGRRRRANAPPPPPPQKETLGGGGILQIDTFTDRLN